MAGTSLLSLEPQVQKIGANIRSSGLLVQALQCLVKEKKDIGSKAGIQKVVAAGGENRRKL